MALTNIACKNAKPREKAYKLTDGGGLYLEIFPNGSKYWRLKYRYFDKEKRLALGVYPEITLEEAREKRTQAKKQLNENKDPSDIKKQNKLIAKIASDNAFEVIALEWLEVNHEKWKTNHAARILKRLQNDIFPHLGKRPISEITSPELLAVIRKIEARGVGDLPKRLLQNCGQIFRYAVATGRAERDPSGDLRGTLKAVKTKHYAFIKAEELSIYLKALFESDLEPLTKLAMQLILHTFVRTIELRGAKWQEINFEKAEWRIPEERMKMKNMHIVPLSKQVLALFKEVRNISGNREYVFPNQIKPKTFMSENTLLYTIYRLGYHSRATVHGFRSTASTTLNEHGFRADVIEKQLAHKDANAVRAAYNHAAYMPERVQMMQWWSDFVEGQV